MKGVQASGEVPEETLDDVVSKSMCDMHCSSLRSSSSKGYARSVKNNIWRNKDRGRRGEQRFAKVLAYRLL